MTVTAPATQANNRGEVEGKMEKTMPPKTPEIPDDLVTVAQAAKLLGRKYTTVQYHLKQAGLIRWERGATRLCSLREVKAYFDEWERVKPIELDIDEEGDEERP